MHGRRVGVLLVAMLVAACGSSSGTPKPSVFSTPQLSTPVPSASLPPVKLDDTTYAAVQAAKTGGALVIGTYQKPTTANPYYARHDYELEFAASLFDGLTRVTPDLHYVPDLAADLPTVENGGVVLKDAGMDVTWHLRSNMAWSDGQLISCDDLRATLGWVSDPNNAGLTVGTAGWGDITGIDGAGQTCTVHFSKVYEGYLDLFSTVLPAHYLQMVAAHDPNAKAYALTGLTGAVFSGPYIPSQVTATAITLKPNPNWMTISGHDPWLKSVTWRYYANAAAMIRGYQAGEIGLAVGLSEEDIPSLNNVASGQVAVRDSLTYELLAFNNTRFKSKFGADAPVIIRAMMLATDRAAIVKGPLGGYVSVIDNFVAPLSWLYRDPGGPTPPDLTSAMTMLANAGWEKDDQGYLAKGRTELDVEYCTTNRQYRADTLALIANQLKAIGIKVNVTTRPNTDVFGTWATTTDQTVCNLARGNFDVAEFSYISPVDPLGGFNAYVSTQTPADTPGHTGQNITGVSIPELDAAYDSIRSTADVNKVRDAMFEIQRIYASDRNTYELPLYFHKDVWLVSPALQNFAGGPTMLGAAWNMGDWWLA